MGPEEQMCVLLMMKPKQYYVEKSKLALKKLFEEQEVLY